VRELMQGPACDQAYCSTRETTSPLLGRSLAVAELAEEIAGTAAARWPGNWHRTAGGEVIEAASRHYPRFRSPAWTWAR
jgi:hypothetical protein